MTAEVAILNKTAVALAADSAVTIRVGDDVKIYNSLKLFRLCSNSIGVMIFNNAEFTSVPWETIIKQYREDSASKTFSTLEDCGNDFISYLTNNRSLFSEELQRASARNVIRHYFGVLAKQ